MKKFFSYLLVLAIILGSVAAFNLVVKEPPQTEAFMNYALCYAGCVVIAKTYCHGCTDREIFEVADECARNECQ